MRVLMVDGLFDEVRELRSQLGFRHEVWAASGGKSVETLFKSAHPDAVVMCLSDLHPDHRKRAEFFQKAWGQRPRILLALAPFTHFKLIQQVLDWGVDAYLATPCDMGRVRKRLEELVGGRESDGTGPIPIGVGGFK